MKLIGYIFVVLPLFFNLEPTVAPSLSPPESWARTTSKEVKGQAMFAWSKTKNVCGHQTIKEWYYYFQCWRNKNFFRHCSTLQGTSSFLKNATLIYVGNFFARSIVKSISLTIEVSSYVSNVTSIVTKLKLCILNCFVTIYFNLFII